MTIKYNPKKYNKLKLIDSNIFCHKANLFFNIFFDLVVTIMIISIYVFAVTLASVLIFEQTFSFLIEDFVYTMNAPISSALIFGNFIFIKCLFHIRNTINRTFCKITKLDFVDDCLKVGIFIIIFHLSCFILFEKELLYQVFDNITIRFLFILSTPLLFIKTGKIIFTDIKNIFIERLNDIKKIKRISTGRNNIIKNIIHTESIQNILAESTPKEVKYYESLFKKNFKEIIYYKKERKKIKEKEYILENL